MSSRKELKEQRRREREEAERRERERARRRRLVQIAGVVAAIAAAGGALGAAALLGVFGEDPGDAFAARPEGMEERAVRAGLTPGADHFHPTVRVVVEGEEVAIPQDVGAAAPGGQHAPIHLHPGDEQIHAEGVEAGTFTLGQFMAVWGVPLTPTQLGPYRESASREVVVFVRRKGERRFSRTEEVADLELGDGDEVYVVYGTPEQSPIVL